MHVLMYNLKVTIEQVKYQTFINLIVFFMTCFSLRRVNFLHFCCTSHVSTLVFVKKM